MLVEFDVTVRDPGHNLRSHLRNLLSFLSLETVGHQPLTDKLLGELLLMLTLGEPLLVALGVEIT